MNKELENGLEIGADLDKKWVILEFIIFIFDQGSVSVQGLKDEIPLEYLAMEFIPGGSLRSTMSDEGFYPDEGLVKQWLRDYFLPVLDGLEALHQAGIQGH